MKIQKLYDELKNEFEKQAKDSGASECVYFEFSLDPKANCGRKDDYCSCKLFNGQECKYFK